MNFRRLIGLALLAALPATLPAHENGLKNRKPTKAQVDLADARKKLDLAKKKLSTAGVYKCCVKPGCDLCLRVNGSCHCAANVAAGKGACGECFMGWATGRGSVKGVDKPQVPLLCAVNQKATAAAPDVPDLQEAIDSLNRAKRTLTGERRYSCCIRGGCTQCAFEASCPCAADLAAGPGKKGKPAGVCGQCVDGWRSGLGSFPGISPMEVTFAPAEMSDGAMGPGGGERSGWYSSGTSQEPREAPMDMASKSLGNWRLSLHGVAFGIYTSQSGPRGREKIFSTNWFMPPG